MLKWYLRELLPGSLSDRVTDLDRKERADFDERWELLNVPSSWRRQILVLVANAR